jgi:hypothetical protein
MQTAADLKKEAERIAEASHYSLSNTYLFPSQKEEVEMWFQMPGKVMVLTFQMIAVYQATNGINWYVLLGFPVCLDAAVTLINWFLYKKKLIRLLYKSVLHQFVIYASGLLSCVYLIYKHHWIVGIVCLAGSVVGFLILELDVVIHTLLARPYRMHPKYAFFKRNYNLIFPFDRGNS